MEVFREISSPSSSSTSSLAIPSSSTATAVAAAAAETGAPLELEHMFDKVVTPSDVGKLNRLVIPKQHAEKYFPLDPASADKGVLLCFEERGAAAGGGSASSGKQWQFRYSYWNSSQSYVMTKGWSRYVKYKQLDSGDTVSFSRSSGGRLFIDCQRQRREQLVRRHPLPVERWARFFSPNVRPPVYSVHGRALWSSYLQAAAPAAPPDNRLPMGGEAATEPPMVPETVTILHHASEPKRVRLFGVDLECAEAKTSTAPAPDPQLVAAPKPPPPLPSIEGKDKVEDLESGSRYSPTQSI